MFAVGAVSTFQGSKLVPYWTFIFNFDNTTISHATQEVNPTKEKSGEVLPSPLFQIFSICSACWLFGRLANNNNFYHFIVFENNDFNFNPFHYMHLLSFILTIFYHICINLSTIFTKKPKYFYFLKNFPVFGSWVLRFTNIWNL